MGSGAKSENIANPIAGVDLDMRLGVSSRHEAVGVCRAAGIAPLAAPPEDG